MIKKELPTKQIGITIQFKFGVLNELDYTHLEIIKVSISGSLKVAWVDYSELIYLIV